MKTLQSCCYRESHGYINCVTALISMASDTAKCCFAMHSPRHRTLHRIPATTVFALKPMGKAHLLHFFNPVISFISLIPFTFFFCDCQYRIMALNQYLRLQQKWDQIFSEYDLRTRVVRKQWNGSSAERCYNYVSVSKLVAENVLVCCICTVCSGIIKIALKQFAHANY